MAVAVAYGVEQAQRLPKGTAQDALSLATNWLETHHPEVPHEQADMPDLRTFQRRMAGINRRIAYERRFGATEAERKFRMFYERPLPDLPLEDVECDHTTLDIMVMDEAALIIYGRPDIITFRDRHSGCILGMSIGWEAPSYASFLDGLRHAIYPKKPDDYPEIQTPWFCWGRFRRLYVDNAMHFIGENIQHAASQLGFQLAEFLPGNPFLKGAQERLFKILNMQVHKLPGATQSNIMERQKLSDVERVPILTLPELRAFLHFYVRDIYHNETHEGLGFLRTLKGIPKVRWNEGIDKVQIVPLPPETDFIALAGDVEYCGINQKGIRWEHIRYASAELEILLSHPKHRRGIGDGDWPGQKYAGTKYKCLRDPFDLGFIYVINPYDEDAEPIKVPAIRGEYANGLTLHQHRVLIANTQSKVLQQSKEPEEILVKARKKVAADIAIFQPIRKKQDIARKLARYLYQGQKQQERSIVTTQTISAELSQRPIHPLAPLEHYTPVPNSTQRTSPTSPVEGSLPDQCVVGGEQRSVNPVAAVSTPGPSSDPFDIETLRKERDSDQEWSDT